MEPVEPLIINLAPTGMVPSRDMTPHVPLSTAQILEDVAACAEVGASLIHVHARDEDGVPTHRSEYFAPVVEGIRSIDPQLIVCVTCSGRRSPAVEMRSEVLELTGAAKPDMASLTLGSNNFAREASINTPDIIVELAKRMNRRGIKPELEVFEPGMVGYGTYLANKGVIREPAYLNILLGNVATSPLSPGSLGAFLSLIPDQWTWAAAGIGQAQLDASAMAIASGGHVRVGLEDNIWWDRSRSQLATNSGLVRRVAQMAELAQRPLASPAQARERLGIPHCHPQTVAAGSGV